MLSNLANTVTISACRDKSFVATVRFVMEFSVAFGKDHSPSTFLARMIDIVEDTVSSNYLFSKGSQIYQSYI